MPVYGTVACINAFAIGAAMADPEVKIQLDWARKQNANWWWDMVNDGIHVVSAVDSFHNTDGSDAYGVCRVERCEPGMGNDLSGTCLITNLAVPVYRRGKLYEIIIRTIIEGTYSSSAVDKKDRATNYWWGMISGVVDIELSDAISPYTRRLVNTLHRDIISANFNPFDGELRSQEGIIRREGDAPLTSMEVITMDWLNENIIGEIPKIDALDDEARATVKYSGVEKSKSGAR
jgi:basic membrane lipoprotein Med (substrate-binding protein (PBP1-ABC) superfamily)